MKKADISEGEYYHIFNRGIRKQVIFHDKSDWQRFLFLILHFQSEMNFPQVGRVVKEFVKHQMLDSFVLSEIIKKRNVDLVNYCLMPNHFHLTLKEIKEGGISKYMQRVLNGYAKYYNTKYQKSGHLFQGKYKAVHIESNEQLLYLSSYIHRNPRELSDYRGKEESYQWSSLEDYVHGNRWGKLLMPGIILEQYKNKDEYEKFVSTSTAKILDEELGPMVLE